MPQTLTRFRAAVLGMGRMEPPTKEGLYAWRCTNFEEAQAVIVLLWRFLGPVKRAQASLALRAIREMYASGIYKPRRSRRKPTPHRSHADHGARPPTSQELERAWAAGFLDAEGCFGMVHSGRRKKGPDWFRVRASASQHGGVAIPAEVLTRLRDALGGLGSIERHGEPDDFRWVTQGAANVGKVLDLTSQWLGEKKLAQARGALHAFDSQEHLKGDSSRCLRGHVYDYQAIRGGRLRRICKACNRITHRKRRAAYGIRPRQFANASRRYSE